MVLLTRLCPVIPFFLLNYAYSLTRVPLRDYVVASWIGMFPATLTFVYLGSAAKSLADLAAGRGVDGPLARILFVVGLCATVVLTVALTRFARQALRARMVDSRKGDATTSTTGGDPREPLTSAATKP
jgi:uncharacterized membrane protein YdjX (TVP38/TMEM64 family)